MNLVGLFFTLLTAFCWGTVPVLYRRNMIEMPFEKLNALRSFGFLGTMAVMVLLEDPKSTFTTPLYVIAIIGVACIIANVIGDVLYMKSVGLMGVGKASSITSMSPLIVMGISVLWLQETVTLLDVLGALSIILGLNIVQKVPKNSSDSTEVAAFRKGLFLAVLAAFCWGCSFPFTKWVLTNTETSPISLNFWRAFVFVPTSWAFWIFRASQMPRREVPLLRTSSWLIFWELLGAGAMALALGGFFLAKALEKSPAALVSPLVSAGMPLTAIIWGIFLFRERLNLPQCLGICCIVGGSIVISL